MNKKLLLSFAVFATALSVNAQKRGVSNFSKNLKPSRNTTLVVQDYDSKLNEFDYSKNVVVNSFDSKVLENPSKKRALETHVDTSLFFDVSRRYLSPRNSSFTIYPYLSKNKDSIEMTALGQTIPNVSKSKFTLNGLYLVVGSRNKTKGSTDVVVKIYDDKGTVLATAAQNLKYVTPTSTNPSPLSFVPFVFDKPFVSNEDITFFIESKTAKDTIAVYTSGAYRDASITCNITGNSLTLVSPAPTSPANLGTSFWFGQVVSGNGIPAGTKITAISQTTPTVYTLSNSVTTALNNVLVTGKNLKFADYTNTGFAFYPKFPILSSGEPDLTKNPQVSVEAIHAINGVPFDAHIICYPIVSYTFDNTFVSTNKCLGDNNEVSVNESVENPFLSIAKNPILNKMSFYSLLDSKAYYHGAAYTKSKSLSDTMFQSRKDFKVTYKATDVTKNDTLIVSSLFWKYGFNKPISQPNQFSNTFLLSSKVTSTVNVIEPIKCFGGVAKVNLSATKGGFPPYVGEGDKTGVKAGDVIVTDKNGCSSDKITQPAAIVPVATVTDAKCSGDKAKIVVTATGGTGAFKGIVTEEVSAVAGEKTYEVEDANLCKASIKATIKAAPAAIVLDTVAVSAENKTKNNGLAVVKVTGGVAPYTYLWNDAAATKNDTLSKVIGAFKVTVTDANGCTKVADAIIRDKKVSVTELGLTNIAVYPNPVKETLNVRFDATSIATVELVNVAGQVLDSKTNSDVTFNTAGLVAGMYFVNIKVAEGVYTHKIIKE
jgi:hypothetical protein